MNDRRSVLLRWILTDPVVIAPYVVLLCGAITIALDGSRFEFLVWPSLAVIILSIILLVRRFRVPIESDEPHTPTSTFLIKGMFALC